MSYTPEDYRRDIKERALKMMTPEERLRGLPAEEIFKRFSPEERLRGLSPEEIEAWLKKVKKKRKS